MPARRTNPLKNLTLIRSMDPMGRTITSIGVIGTEIWFFSGKKVIAVEDTMTRDAIYYNNHENPSFQLTL
jgi:hypothetical protein